MTGSIHWLASYPKSGNTWARVLFTNYLRNGDEPADINTLDGGPIASARAVFDEHVGVEASDLTQDEIERLRPAVYNKISEEITVERQRGGVTSPALMKVHDAMTRTSDGTPIIPASATAGAIYLIRDPRDVVESFAHHWGKPVERIVERMADPHMSFVERGTQLHDQLVQRLLSWSGHVTSWVDNAAFPVHVVRYEDLVDAPLATFAAMVEFVGLDVEMARLEQAVRFSSFDTLQRQEFEIGFGEIMAGAGSFFRRGRARAWETSLDADLARLIERNHREIMSRFGYLEPDTLEPATSVGRR